jgi:GDP-D-mannose 3', 5'-epimerase
VLGWEPSITLEEGLAITYRWIEGELARAGRIPARAAAAAAQ